MKTAWIKWGCFSVLMLLLAGLAYAIILPNISSHGGPHSTKNDCIYNLKQIDGAIQQWALEHKVAGTAAPDLPAAQAYLKDGKLPICPSGGTYAAGKTVADAPTCSKAAELGHSLPGP